MEEQLHRHTAGTNVHEEDRGTKSVMKKVKEKVEKMKDTVKHGHGSHDQHKDEAHNINNSAVVRSGLVQPTVMGTPVLAEDLYTATHSDIVDPPTRSFSQWEEEEIHGDPPPLSTGVYGTHPEDLSQFGRQKYQPDASRQQHFKDSTMEQAIDEDPYYPNATAPVTGYATHFKATGMVTDPYDPTTVPTTGYAAIRVDAPTPQPQTDSIDVYTTHPAGDHAYKQDVDTDQSRTVMGKDPSAPNPTMMVSPGNYQTKVTDTTNTGGKEATGITDILHSFDKMKVFEEPRSKFTKPDQGETEVFTGSHDQFAPEPVENPPLDTVSSDPSNPNSSYTEKITSATSAIGHKAAAVKDSIVSKFSSSNEDKTDMSGEPHKTKTKPTCATDYAHVVADTLSGTLGPVYERVADAGSSVMSKMQGSAGRDESVTSPSGTSKGAAVKEYFVDAFKPGDEDKVLSEKITSVFNRGKANAPQEITTTKTTTYVIRDEGERRLQDSGN